MNMFVSFKKEYIMKKILVCSLLALLMSGCMVTRINAPMGKDVTLVDRSVQLPVTIKKNNWYAIFGAVPFNEQLVENLIQEHQLKQVRIETKYRFVNFLLNAVCNSIFPTTLVSNTVVIYGSYEAAPEKGTE